VGATPIDTKRGRQDLGVRQVMVEVGGRGGDGAGRSRVGNWGWKTLGQDISRGGAPIRIEVHGFGWREGGRGDETEGSSCQDKRILRARIG